MIVFWLLEAHPDLVDGVSPEKTSQVKETRGKKFV